ncbi:hypothetical protein K7X08_034459 [Anisodus acutangulus]|uniref:RNA helicase n=1 Tax=Anisodus acutangulus TaxID=402998 RepID=A0A9Q1R1N0_9SOLA|nr:hypothetical protein K7X08_034459 [Anisodus acutangulus]
MLELRRNLPAYKEREALLRAISENQVMVVSGETGCGKTTQLPQYILEAEIEAARGATCNIICTQPRRISAISLKELLQSVGRVSENLWAIRKLEGVTHIIVDEIHERGMNEDFLLIVLKDLLPRQPELRLLLMNATLNAELFSSYFGGAPMIHIPKQQTIKKRKTQIASAVEEALEASDFEQYNPLTRDSLSCWNPDSIGFNLIEHVLCHICRNERPGGVLVFMTGWDDINSVKDQLQAHPLLGDPSRVLLLACYGSMASAEQKLIFDKPEDGIRKIVLATNMAETSITVNDVVFVVDCGKAKETSYDAINNTPCLLPSWISKASARQRKGRAGRVQSGECYHLYPRCVFEAFADYQLPELLRTPLQSLCLQIKSLQLESISDFLSKAMQSPEPLSVQNAIEYLKTIGALDENENLTVLGHNLSMLPVEPKLGEMIILGVVFNCLDPVLTVVTGLSARDPFLMPFDKKDLAESAKAQFSARHLSDHLALVRAYEGWKDAERQQSGYGFQSCNAWSNNEHLVRTIICGGLFPGICSVVNKKSISLKTMEDGGVLLYSNSVSAQEPRIPYPWLVFNEKVKHFWKNSRWTLDDAWRTLGEEDAV